MYQIEDYCISEKTRRGETSREFEFWPVGEPKNEQDRAANPPVRLQISYRKGNTAYRDKLNRLQDTYRADRNLDPKANIPSDAYLKIVVQAHGGTVLRGWAATDLGSLGKPFEYSEERAEQLLESWPALFGCVCKCADEDDEFTITKMGLLEKN